MADKVSKPSLAKRLIKDQRVLLAIVIAIIVVVVSLINPNFIGISNIVAIFQQICVLGILTMAMSILLISGGIGNLIDRILHGYVIDYIHVLFFDYVFNFADCCITVGAVLFVIHVLFFTGKGEERPAKEVEEE